jgi:hypothetical protein
VLSAWSFLARIAAASAGELEQVAERSLTAPTLDDALAPVGNLPEVDGMFWSEPPRICTQSYPYFRDSRPGSTQSERRAAFDRVCTSAHQRLPNNERMTDWWPYRRWFDGHRPEAPKEYGYWDKSKYWLDMTSGKMADNFLALARDLCSGDLR